MEEYESAVGLDFDGVVHSYKSGWQGEDIIPDSPVEGVKWAIDQLRRVAKYKVIVWSTRCKTERGKEAIKKWLVEWKIAVDDIVAYKPVCLCYVDDRGITFNGDWVKTYLDIIAFKSYIEKGEIMEKSSNNQENINGKNN